MQRQGYPSEDSGIGSAMRSATEATRAGERSRGMPEVRRCRQSTNGFICIQCYCCGSDCGGSAHSCTAGDHDRSGKFQQIRDAMNRGGEYASIVRAVIV